MGSESLVFTWKWYGHNKSLKIKEPYHLMGVDSKYDLSLYIEKYDRTAYEIDYFEMFAAVYERLQSITGCRDLKNKTVEIGYDHINFPYRMTANIRQHEVPDIPILLWSLCEDDQERAKAEFSSIWADLQRYHDHVKQQITLILLKEKRRKKREMNDPDNPAARKRKARRHLQRLGYDLHKSRRIATTSDDKGLYQIVATDTQAIVAGEKYDLTLEQVELFYKNLDCKQRTFGSNYNLEVDFETRKASVTKGLEKHGYLVEMAPYRKERYGERCYCLFHRKSKRHIYNPNDPEAGHYFSLSDLEQFLSSYPSKIYKKMPY